MIDLFIQTHIRLIPWGVRRVARSYSWIDEDTAESLAYEALWRTARAWDESRGAVVTLFWAVLRNLCRTESRAARRRVPVTLDEDLHTRPAPEPPEGLDMEWYGKLAGPAKRVVDRLLAGERVSDIARSEGRGRQAVYQQLYREAERVRASAVCA